MKQLLFLLGCAVLLSALAGCQNPAANKSGGEVIIEGGSKFPPFLAGTWETDKSGLNYWRIIFEPDGTISSAVVPLGKIKVRPNRTTKVPGPKGEPGFCTAGNFQTSYDPQSRELAATIELKQFYMYMGVISIIKGSWGYFIVGEVSEDGKTWAGDVFTSPDIVLLVPDPNHKGDESKFKEGAKLRIGLGEEEEERFIFTKVPDEKAGSNK